MIRPIIQTITDNPEKVSLRGLVEWWKRVANSGLGTPTAEEVKYINDRWASLIVDLSAIEDVPVGWLSWCLQELAQSELTLMDTVTVEAQAAMAYGQEEQG